MPVNHMFFFVPTDAMLHGDILMCAPEQKPPQHSSPVDCEWPPGVDVRCSDGQRVNMSDADVLGYLLQEQQVYIELTFPAPILQKGLVLIDSPGVGEATRLRERPLTSFVIKEAQKADAFVYVLDAKRGTPTEEDERTLIGLLGYRNQISRLSVEYLLEHNPIGSDAPSLYYLITTLNTLRTWSRILTLTLALFASHPCARGFTATFPQQVFEVGLLHHE